MEPAGADPGACGLAIRFPGPDPCCMGPAWRQGHQRNADCPSLGEPLRRWHWKSSTSFRRLDAHVSPWKENRVSESKKVWTLNYNFH